MAMFQGKNDHRLELRVVDKHDCVPCFLPSTESFCACFPIKSCVQFIANLGYPAFFFGSYDIL